MVVIGRMEQSSFAAPKYDQLEVISPVNVACNPKLLGIRGTEEQAVLAQMMWPFLTSRTLEKCSRLGGDLCVPGLA